MSTNHRPRLARVEYAARQATTGTPASIAEALGAKSGIHPGEILAEAERLWQAAGPNPTTRRMVEIAAEEIGISVADIDAEAAALLADETP